MSHFVQSTARICGHKRKRVDIPRMKVYHNNAKTHNAKTHNLKITIPKNRFPIVYLDESGHGEIDSLVRTQTAQSV